MVFYFLIAWKAPFPPITTYGIELGFISAPSEPQRREANSIPQQETPQESENEQAPISEETPIENAQEEDLTETVLVDESAVLVENETIALPDSENKEQADEVANETTPESEIIPNETDQVEENTNETSEQENETIDTRAIYGSQGTETDEEDGASLSLSGWKWDFKPKPEDDSEDIGKIVYKIAVDQDGYLIRIEVLTSTVSPATERKYRQAVEKLTFSKTSEYKPASQSYGTLTFIIQSR